jgi:hypothetical protein
MQYGSKEYISYTIAVIAFCGILFFFTQNVIFILLALILSPFLIIPYTGKVITTGWKKITHFISKLVNTALLSIVFFFFLLPLALIRRMFNKGRKKESEDFESYFETVKKVYRMDDVLKAW